MATMTKTNPLEHLKARLYAEREDLARRTKALAGGLHIEQAAESLDAVSNQQARDHVAGDLRRLRQQSADVECAIARWNLGCFGECIACDEPIKAARLEVLPWAANCTRCQSRLEANAAQERSGFAGGDE